MAKHRTLRKRIFDAEPKNTRILSFGVVIWGVCLVTYLAVRPGYTDALKMVSDPIFLMISGVVLGYGGIRTFDRHSVRKFEAESGADEDGSDRRPDEDHPRTVEVDETRRDCDK